MSLSDESFAVEQVMAYRLGGVAVNAEGGVDGGDAMEVVHEITIVLRPMCPQLHEAGLASR